MKQEQRVVEPTGVGCLQMGVFINLTEAALVGWRGETVRWLSNDTEEAEGQKKEDEKDRY